MEITLNLTSEDREEAYTSGFAIIIVDIMDQILREYNERGERLNGALFRTEVLNRLQQIYNPMSTIMVMLVFRLVDVFIIGYSGDNYDTPKSNNKIMYS